LGDVSLSVRAVRNGELTDAPVRMAGNPRREFTIEVVAGQTAERKVDFSQ
jgi:hypothetical protein